MKKMKTFILEHYLAISVTMLFFAGILTVVSTYILQKGAEYGAKNDSEVTRGKINDGVDATIEQIVTKFDETSKVIDSNAQKTIKNINLQGQDVIDELSKKSKNELDSLREEIERIQIITDKIAISTTPSILEFEYVLPLIDFPRNVSFSLAQHLCSDFTTSVTVIRSNQLIANFVCANQPFRNIHVNQTRREPIDFKKENIYIVYLGDHWTPEKDKYYIKYCFALEPDEIKDFGRIKSGDKINLIRTQISGLEFPIYNNFFKLEPKIQNISIKIGQTTYKLENNENLFMKDNTGGMFSNQIIHCFSVIN